jgi:hypothetical protein
MSFHHLRSLILLLSFPLMLLSASCANLFSSGPLISEVTTTTGFTGGYHPADRTNVFYIDSPQICCSAKLSGAHPNTAVLANWIYIHGAMATQAKPLVQSDKAICDGDCYVGFTLPSSPEGYIAGEYRVEISSDTGHPISVGFFIQRDESGPLPVISSFSASALDIVAGQSTDLKWRASNATRVSIQPSLRTVQSEGLQDVFPASDTTYTLWALNRRGSSSSSISIKVTPVVTDKADLLVTDFWNTGNVLFYKVKNIGNLASSPSDAYLYKNDVLVSKDYTQPLDPGQERVESFGSYHFSPRFPSIIGSAVPDGTTDAVNMRVCLNGSQTCLETDNSNNCMEHNFGPLWNLHLEHYAYTAQWLCSTGALKWPMLRDNSGGWAQIASAQVDGSGIYPDSLLMSPPQSVKSWMEARIGLPLDQQGGLQPFYIPHKCKISAKVGLSREVPDASIVKFTIGTMQGREVTYYPPVTIDAKGKLVPYEIDLSRLTGKQVLFVLRVESSGPLQQGSAVWIDPTITQEW